MVETYGIPSLAAAVFSLIVIGATLAVGVVVLSEIQGSSSFPTDTLNFSRTFINNTWYNLPYRAASVVSVGNDSGTLSNNGSHYTYRDGDPTTSIRLTVPGDPGDGKGAGAVYNVTFAAYSTDSAMALQNSTGAISSLADWLPLIALVIVAGIVVSVLVISFS